MSSAIIKADAGWFAIFAVPGKPWTTNRLPVLAWRVEACEACGDDLPIAEPVTVAGNGVLEGWKPAAIRRRSGSFMRQHLRYRNGMAGRYPAHCDARRG